MTQSPVLKEDLVALTIDGVEVEVPKGTLIIRAAEHLDIEIPRFCDHRLLTPVAACRQCLVEVEGQKKPVASCAQPVAPGMVVKTAATSEVAATAQEQNIEFLLINHPLDCPQCDKGGECPLQDQTLRFGPAESRFHEVKRHFEKPIKIGETVLLDRERCVQCARCTRFQNEIAGDPFIELFERGAAEQVSIFFDQPFQSYFSGNTVQICPVGALTSPSYRFQARPFDLASTPAVCNHCSSGCNLRLDARRGLVTRQLASDNDEVNEAWSCDRGRYGFAYAQAGDRVLAPLVRNGGRLVTASWSEALRRAAEGITAATAGGAAAGVLAGGHLTDQDAYALQKLARVALRTNNVDARTWTTGQGEDAVEAAVAGAPLGPTYADLEAARLVVVVDLDPHEESPILYLRLRKAALRKDTRVVVVGSRPGRLADFATAVPTEPGGQAAALTDLAAGKGPAGDAIGGEGPVVVLAGWRAALTGGLVAAVQLAHALGGSFGWVPRRAGDRGALDAGCRPGLLPGGRLVADPAARAELAAVWSADLPAEPGLDARGIVRGAAEGSVGALVLAGVDLVRDHGPRALAEAALDRAFVVAVDHALTETTSQADIVLPALVHAETEGTYTDWEGRIQATHAAVPIGGMAQAVWELADQLGIRLGTDLKLPNLDRVVAETAEWRRRPAPGVVPAGTPVAPVDGAQGPSGRKSLALVSYPLLYDAGSLLAGARDLERSTQAAFVEVHPDDAARLGLVDGGRTEADFGEGPSGPRRLRLPVRVSPTTAPGCAFIPANQPDLPLVALLGPELAVARCELRAIPEEAAA